MISVEDALKHIRSNQPKLGEELISVEEALARTLSENIFANLNIPPFISAIMDGYAVSDCKTQDLLTIIGESATGQPFPGRINAKKTVRISTAAKVPYESDRIYGENVGVLLLRELGLPQ